MQFAPERISKEERMSLVENLNENEILIKLTGREDINFNPHVHNRHQIIYILSGTLHIEIEGVSHFVADRHLVWIPKGKLHRLSSNNRQISLLVIYFYTEKQKDDNFTILGTDEMIVRNLKFVSSFGLINMYESPEIYSFVFSFLNVLPCICRKPSFLAQSVVVTDDNRLKPIMEYIKQNLDKELTIESVASKFGLSSRSLTRMFTNSGIRFVHYLNYNRIVRAIEILSDNTLNIEQTAYKVGFNSPNSFSRVFRQITGESPTSYIKKNDPQIR